MSRPKRDLPWFDLRGKVYYVFWYNAEKRRTDRLSLRTGDLETAKHRFAAFLTTGLDGVLPPSAKARYTTDAALDAYMKEHFEVNTVAPQNGRYIVRWLKTHFAGVPVADIDIPMCRQYAKRRMTGDIGHRPVSQGTVRQELTILRAAIGHAVKWRRISPKDVPYIERPEAPESRLRWLTHEELDKLRWGAKSGDEDIADFIDIAYYTAARRTSIEELTVEQIDLTTQRIDLNPPGRRRTRKRKPIIPIFPEIHEVITRRVAEATRLDTSYILGGGLYRKFRKAVEVAGLQLTGPDKVTPHTLRHTRASHLLMSGVHPNAVAGLLGDSVDMLLKVYGHFCPDYMREAITATSPSVAVSDFRAANAAPSREIVDLLA